MHRLLKGGLLITCDDTSRVLRADLRLIAGRIAEIGPDLAPSPPAESADLAPARVTELGGAWVLPGFVQTHVHLCQTLFRGYADDLALMDWLRTRIWPLEAAHDEESVYWSARLGVTELLLGGTTAILDMGTVHHTDSLFRACQEAGIRAHIGRAMMDRENEAGLSQPTEISLAGACDEADRWHGATDRLAYAFAPRFVPSCTEGLLREVVAEARARGCLIHTHASENRDEVELVRSLTGRDNVIYLHEIGLSGPDVCLAHCIHLTDDEERLLAETGTRLLHCPSSNLKLGSGIARIPELLDRGVHVSVGADGAPCNNRLDMFTELRSAALIQKPRLGPTAMPAGQTLALGTRRGAEALGLQAGELAPGQLADLTILDPDAIACLPSPDPVSAVVYAGSPQAIHEVWIGGEPVVRGGSVVGWDTAETIAGVRASIARVAGRAGLA